MGPILNEDGVEGEKREAQNNEHNIDMKVATRIIDSVRIQEMGGRRVKNKRRGTEEI